MKMLQCLACGLTIMDAQEECPRCHTKNSDLNKEALAEKASSPPEVVDSVIEADDAMLSEAKRLEAIVEAQALASIAEDEIDAKQAHLCEACDSLVEHDQSFCQLCGFLVNDATNKPESLSSASVAAVSLMPKADESTNKFIAMIGYLCFFLPIFYGYYKKSTFINFHAKQARRLFKFSVLLFLGLVLSRNLLVFLFTTTTPHQLHSSVYFTANTMFRHGLGRFFYYYLDLIINLLHLMPFALMLVGCFNAIYGKQKQLPLINRPLFPQVRRVLKRLATKLSA